MIRHFLSCSLLIGAALIHLELINHTYQPTATDTQLPQWPLGSSFEDPCHEPLLIVFAHPQCPCFKATLSSLVDLSNKFPDLDIRVVFAEPEGAPKGWCSGANWDRVQAAGFVAVADTNCLETHRFYATCSGQLMLFKDGRCLFRGGITIGRGHVGPCAGSVEVERILNGGTPSLIAYPVFGCPLLN